MPSSSRLVRAYLCTGGAVLAAILLGPPALMGEEMSVDEISVDQAEKAAGGFSFRRFRPSVLPVAAAVLVLVVHFRPWQQGLLEDWGLALAWKQEGFGGYVARLPATLGRPLHLLPHFVGMALSNGGFVGPYAVLTAVALGQLLCAAWALAPVVSSRALRWGIALAIAVHPWWAGGDILRFMPAQVAVLGVVVWLGAAVRFLEGRRAAWLVLATLAPLAGLLTYEGPLAALLIGAFTLTATGRASVRRRLAVFGSTVLVAAAVVAWSAVIAPAISPQSYEGQLVGGLPDPRASVVAIARTMLHHTPALLLALAIVGLIVLDLGFSRRVGRRDAWVLLVATVSAPLAALAYAATSLHLHDPERVGLPVGLAAWLVLCVAAPAITAAAAPRRVVLAVLLLGSVAGAVAGYRTWTTFAEDQQQLIRALEPVRAAAPPGSTVVVADESGRWGDVYLFLPPHLALAMQVEQGAGAAVELCTQPGVARRQPVAEVYPISTTPDCGADSAAGSTGGTTISVGAGPVDVFVRPKPVG